jgi:hypothetical protein
MMLSKGTSKGGVPILSTTTLSYIGLVRQSFLDPLDYFKVEVRRSVKKGILLLITMSFFLS